MEMYQWSWMMGINEYFVIWECFVHCTKMSLIARCTATFFVYLQPVTICSGTLYLSLFVHLFSSWIYSRKVRFFSIELCCNASICVIRPRSEYQFNQLKVRKGLPWITVEKTCLKSGTLYLSFLYWLVLNTNLRSISAISWHM